MKKEELFEILGDIDEKHIRNAYTAAPKHNAALWGKWAGLAACFLAVMLVWSLRALSPESPVREEAAGEGPPHIIIDNQIFYISPYLSVSDTLPDGFEAGGEAWSDGMGEACPYYVNPNIPEWVYVYHEVRTDGTVDEHGTLTQTEPHKAYVRYVDQRLRGKHLLRCNGKLYISMWDAAFYEECPDADEELYNTIRDCYGIRIENEVPDGFSFIGTANFSGHDTIPRLELSSNDTEADVYANPDNTDFLFVSTHWFTATDEEKSETRHDGFDIYILYTGPLKIE